MTGPGSIRVLIAEDHAEYRAALSHVIDRTDGLELAGAAADAAEAIELAALALPDVALVDLRMPAGGGAVAVHGIAQRSPDTRVIVVSASDISDAALEDRVVARLLKSTSAAAIVEAVKRAARSAAPAPSEDAGSRPQPGDPTIPFSAAARIVHSGHGERERIEQQLHEHVQSRLAALRIHLGIAAERADGASSRPILDNLVAQLDEVIDELRRIALEIYPRLLASHGLDAALRTIERDARIALISPPPASGRLPRRVENTLYFFCIDLLRRAALHGGAAVRSVEIRLADVDGAIRCCVEVDGADADVDAFPADADLLALSDPIAAMGGTLRVESASARGVRLIAEVPVPPIRR